MKVDYNEISKKYDDVRSADVELINLFLSEVDIRKDAKILDFGCGTGNYADKIQRITGAQVYGVDPSDGMREKAKAKNPDIVFAKGNHKHIPFKSNYFDFVYMTDVIHHIPDLDKMFIEIHRILNNSGKLCIVTQSHKQIEGRFYVKYFPTTALVDKKRYPDIDEIVGRGERNGFKHIKSEVVDENRKVRITKSFIELVNKKGYSMFHLIPEEEYENGLRELQNDFLNKDLSFNTSGGTLVWFGKE